MGEGEVVGSARPKGLPSRPGGPLLTRRGERAPGQASKNLSQRRPEGVRGETRKQTSYPS
jgi:hypothetical protein